MKEIKFRAWHTVQKKMYTCEEMVADQLTLLTDGRFINVDGRFTQFSEVDDDGVMIPLQYTGLKDCDGVEIYEGDIISQWPGISSSETVVWDHQGAKFEAALYGNYTPANEFIEYAIIGNIYENPELMEKD